MHRRGSVRRKRAMPMAGSRPSRPKYLASAWALAAMMSVLATAHAQGPLVPYTVEGDAIPAPLTGAKGDATRGRAIVGNRQVGLCLLCHTGPFPEERFQGTLAPNLSGAGNRWSEGQLRLRIVDSRRLYQ